MVWMFIWVALFVSLLPSVRSSLGAMLLWVDSYDLTIRESSFGSVCLIWEEGGLGFSDGGFYFSGGISGFENLDLAGLSIFFTFPAPWLGVGSLSRLPFMKKSFFFLSISSCFSMSDFAFSIYSERLSDWDFSSEASSSSLELVKVSFDFLKLSTDSKRVFNCKMASDRLPPLFFCSRSRTSEIDLSCVEMSSNNFRLFS